MYLIELCFDHYQNEYSYEPNLSLIIFLLQLFAVTCLMTLRKIIMKPYIRSHGLSSVGM